MDNNNGEKPPLGNIKEENPQDSEMTLSAPYFEPNQ